ncbi:MarR family transcriptional regulator [Novosphingopyxis iocasae]|uniref:MarR family transcriptional regulator n=1 Tax=Novosphingopyxis iocasae TaxID=2762729 RepID=UPI0016510253|nr:helix-turn-helix domain-containing protein [Novosphingopyxis iocasae]|tara:strand:- start:533 stop:835 length:303 start_codon:yes stop_codon:yes gene_type:complete
MNEKEDLLPVMLALLATSARAVFPPDELFSLIAASGDGSKQVLAYNSCTGLRTQSEIAELTGYDRGNFSRLVNRWIEAGVVFRLANGNLRFLYLLPDKRK